MKKDGFICTRCKKIEGKEVLMIEKHDMLVCPGCKTSFYIKGKSPLGRYKETWNKNADDVFTLLRPPFHLNDIENPRLYFLYEDCYHTLLVGHYNASIVLLGVLLEALMKERIWLRLCLDFHGAFGDCLKKIVDHSLMKPEDVKFLKKFKDLVRNPYQHADESQILQGVFVKAWPLAFKKGMTLKKLEKAMQKVKSGNLRPRILPAWEIPAMRSAVKQAYDRQHAINLFNQVYDFLLAAKIKYFKKEEYEELQRKFGTKLQNVEHHEL